MLGLGSHAFAQIAHVKTIGTATSTSTGTATAITAPAAGVAAGSSIILSFAMDPATGTVSCTDTVSNSYVLDRDITNGSGTSGVRSVILSAHNVVALVSGNTITCTHPSVTARALSANEFSGIAATGARDQTAASSGSSTAPSSGSTPTTTQAVELLVGAIGVEGKSNETFTPGVSFTTVGRVGTNAGNAANNITINPEYRTVVTTGAYSATATLGNSRKWAATIATYKAKVVAAKLAITSVHSGANPTSGQAFSLVVQSQKSDGTPVIVVNPTGFGLAVTSGIGNLAAGTTSGTIPAGTNQVTVTGVIYSKADLGVILRATQSSGDPVSPGDSAPFTVNAGSPSKLAFINQPANSTTSGAIKGPPTVAVQDSLGNAVTSSTASITVAIGANPGGGALSGTTAKNASGGIAAFADLHLNNAANGYTLTATAPSLTSASTSAFNISAGGSVTGSVTKVSGGGAISGALVEALQSGVVKGTGSSGSSGSYTITGLVPGNYDIRGTAGGFTPQTQAGVTVNSGATATANFSLAVATPAAGIVYIYDELQRLKSVIDPIGEAATYAYDAVGNLTGITRNNSSQTSIVDFNPNSGAVGGTVTIYGTGYSATPSQNTVTFNGVAATVASATLTQIVTTVPAGAATGAIAVTSPAGSATSATNFAVTGSSTGAPSIASFTPTIGTVGTAVTITGTNFDTTLANNEVHFNPTLAPITGATPTSIQTTVPVAARSGKISVATSAGVATSTQDFFVAPGSFTAADVEFAGRITIGGPSVTATISTPNKIALLIFDGVAGQKVGLGVTGNTMSNVNTNTFIFSPTGTQVAWDGYTGVGLNLNMTLPVTGTYTMLIDPYATGTGSVTFTLSEEIDAGSIVTDGSPVTVTIPRVAQWARMSFSGTVGQKIALGVPNQTMSTSNTNTFVFNPDGSQLGWDGYTGTGMNINVTLPVTGTYSILTDPYSTGTGTVTYVLSTEVDAGSIVIDGSPVTVTMSRVAQRGFLTFSGSAGQMVRLTVPNQTMSGSNTNTFVFKPDGSQLDWNGYTNTGMVLDMTLPVTGTYTILVDPYAASTGSVTYSLVTF